MKKTNKLSRDEWIKAATKLLSTGGVDKVRVDHLAKQLRITRGSFYHHFNSRLELLEGILKKWRSKATEDIIRRLQQDRNEPLDKIIYLMNLPTKGAESIEAASIEISIRVWARNDNIAREAVEEVDQYRLSFLKQIFIDLGHTDTQSEDLSSLIYSYIVSMSLIYFDNEFEARRQKAVRIVEYLLTRKH